MPRYKLTIAYDGTDFCGWQKQFPHVGAVPGELTRFREGDPDDPFASAHSGLDSGSDVPSDIGNSPRAGRTDGTSVPLSPSSTDDRPRAELRTVQSVVERAVRQVVRQPVVLVGASRTDSGVHARGQVCAFTTREDPEVDRGSGVLPDNAESDQRSDKTSSAVGTHRASEGKTGRLTHCETGSLTNFERFGGGWPLERGTDALVRAVNSRLPEDVLCRAAEVVAPDFDPIAGATRKSYSYTIHNSKTRPLWDRRTALHVWHDLDVRQMNAAAQLLVGEHDFAAFAAAGHNRLTTVRTVFSCGVRGEKLDAPFAIHGESAGQRIVIDISGSGFLWNMVRIIAGTLIEAGRGRLSADQIRRALAEGDRRLAGPTAPAHGLCLEWIKYRA